MQIGYFSVRFPPVVRSFLLATDRTLKPLEFLQPLPESLRVLEGLPVAANSQRLDAKINPDDRMGIFGGNGIWNVLLDLNGAEPMPRMFTDGRRKYFYVTGRDVARFLEPDGSKDGQLDRLLEDLDGSSQAERTDAVPLGLEFWEADFTFGFPALEEVVERTVKIAESFLSAALAGFVNPRHGRLEGVPLAMQFDGVRDFGLGCESGFLLR